MKRVLLALVLVSAVAVSGAAADRSGGTPIPYRVIPLDDAGVFVKNWADQSMPSYSIIGNMEEWRSVFQPAATMGGKKPFQPDPAIFADNILVTVSRVTDAPAPGEKVLVIKSFVYADGEAVMTYDFIPPKNKASFTVKNTLLVMMPARYQDVIRFVEDEQSAGSLAAGAELEAAKAAGLYKQPQPAPMPVPPPAAAPVQRVAPAQAPRQK